MIIGLTGRNGAGKGEVAEYLKKSGYQYHSLSDVIRDTIRSQGLEITRERLIETGRHLRTTGGPSVLADMILKKIDIDKNYVIDSIRHPAEVRALKNRENFFLIFVDADQKIRFERTVKRNRESDPITFEDFVRLEGKELANTDEAGQQLLQTQTLADAIIQNNGSLEELHNLVKNTTLDFLRKKKRPGWDDYFMNIARVASLRSNCMKRKVAAVIVRDKRIISTGYNGTPRGLKNCDDGGCPRCNSFTASGTDLGECLCSHAEENAIVQSAYHGVSIKGSTLYTTFSPCLMCTKMIINSGINEVVYNANYPLGEVPLKLLKEAYIKVRQAG